MAKHGATGDGPRIGRPGNPVGRTLYLKKLGPRRRPSGGQQKL